MALLSDFDESFGWIVFRFLNHDFPPAGAFIRR